MEARDLKSRIAHYLLAKISKNLTKRLTNSPFEKIIKLPQMLGLSEFDRNLKFNLDKILGFWKYKYIDSWTPTAREYAT